MPPGQSLLPWAQRSPWPPSLSAWLSPIPAPRSRPPLRWQRKPASKKSLSVPVRTRFMIGLDKSAAYTVTALTNPNRVVIDVPIVGLRLPPDPGPNPVGLVRSIRSGNAGAGQTKVIIEVTEPVVIEKTKIEKATHGKGFHLAVDILPAGSVMTTAKKPLKSPAVCTWRSGHSTPLPMPAKRPGRCRQSCLQTDHRHRSWPRRLRYRCRKARHRRKGCRSRVRQGPARQNREDRPVSRTYDPRYRRLRSAR